MSGGGGLVLGQERWGGTGRDGRAGAAWAAALSLLLHGAALGAVLVLLHRPKPPAPAAEQGVEILWEQSAEEESLATGETSAAVAATQPVAPPEAEPPPPEAPTPVAAAPPPAEAAPPPLPEAEPPPPEAPTPVAAAPLAVPPPVPEPSAPVPVENPPPAEPPPEPPPPAPSSLAALLPPPPPAPAVPPVALPPPPAPAVAETPAPEEPPEEVPALPLPPPPMPTPPRPMAAAARQAAPPAPTQAQPQPGPWGPGPQPLVLGGSRVTGAVTPPALLDGHRNLEPEYPGASRQRGEQGVVTVRLRVSEAGEVTGVEILSTSGYPALDEAARRAVLRWRFRPAMRDGAPVPGDIRTAIHFRLR